MTELSLDLAVFIADVDPGTAVRQHTGRLVAAAIATAFAGADSAAVRAALATVDTVPAGPVRPLVSDVRMTVTDAALVTGTAAAAGGDGDVDNRSIAAVVAAGVAHAELAPVAGDELRDALAVGIEVALRFRASVGQPYLDRGWDVTGVAGSVGAAAAVARLAGTPSGITTQALGVAATQGAGLRAAVGTDTWTLHVGKAAANGVEATLLCAAGFSGPPAGIAGRRGFLPVAAPEGDPSRLTNDLGTAWLLLDAQPDGTVAPPDGLAAAFDDDGEVIGRIREVSRSGHGVG